MSLALPSPSTTFTNAHAVYSCSYNTPMTVKKWYSTSGKCQLDPEEKPFPELDCACFSSIGFCKAKYKCSATLGSPVSSTLTYPMFQAVVGNIVQSLQVQCTSALLTPLSLLLRVLCSSVILCLSHLQSAWGQGICGLGWKTVKIFSVSGCV